MDWTSPLIKPSPEEQVSIACALKVESVFEGALLTKDEVFDRLFGYHDGYLAGRKFLAVLKCL